MSWLLLALAILFEVCGTSCLKLSEGFSRPLYGWLMFGLYAAAFTSLSYAVKDIELSIAYAIWAGAGTALIAIIAVFFFREPMTLLKALFILMIVAGVSGLNLVSRAH